MRTPAVKKTAAILLSLCLGIMPLLTAECAHCVGSQQTAARMPKGCCCAADSSATTITAAPSSACDCCISGPIAPSDNSGRGDLSPAPDFSAAVYVAAMVSIDTTGVPGAIFTGVSPRAAPTAGETPIYILNAVFRI